MIWWMVLRSILSWIGICTLDIREMHYLYIQGRISASGLYRNLKPSMVDAFVTHHESVKEDFEESERLGFTKMDDKPEALQDIVNDPLMQTILAQKGIITSGSHGRRQIIFRLHQLDTLIHGEDFEKNIARYHGKKNIVKRMN